MLPIHTILHPTDFSDRSETAFHVACRLARDYGARLVVVHVKTSDLLGGEVYAMATNPREIRQELQGKLESIRPSDPSIPIEYLLKEGTSATEILRAAKDSHCDLIVMGTHGRTGIGRLLMGSVAEAVVRQAFCPVLTIKTPFPEIASKAEATAED